MADKVNVDDALKRIEELEARKKEIVQEAINGLLRQREEIDEQLKRLGYGAKKTASTESGGPKRTRRTKEQIAADKLKDEQEKAEKAKARLVKKEGN